MSIEKKIAIAAVQMFNRMDGSVTYMQARDAVERYAASEGMTIEQANDEIAKFL